jgi:hypothetical protein
MSTLSSVPQHSSVTTVPLVVGGLALHGVAHLAGTSAALKAIHDHDAVTILGGAVTAGSRGPLLALAAIWTAISILFVVAAACVGARSTSARTVLTVATVASLVMSVVSLWAAVIGVAIDLVILTAIHTAPQEFGFDE